jgi:hypothetical protein
MRFAPDIQKLEREKRLEKRQEIRELTSPLRIKRRMKPPIPTRPRTLLESMERRPEEKGEVSLEISTEEPNDPSESMERRLEERGKASSSSSTVMMVQIEATTLENMSSMINEGIAIVMTNNTYASVVDILQRDLRIEHGEATIWNRLDELGRITARLMIQRLVFGNWVVIMPEFGSQNIIIQYSDPTVNPPCQHY